MLNAAADGKGKRVGLDQEALRALLAISNRRLSASDLARHLGVSRASAARVVARLRATGLAVVSVCASSGWHYEWRDADGRLDRRWKALQRLRGFIAGKRGRLKSEDAEIYGT